LPRSMSSPIARSPSFDVFLCHNSEDKPTIEKIAAQLQQQGISCWLDKEQLPPGCYWLETQARDMSQVQAVAVFLGQHGLGKWQRLEVCIFLQQFVEEQKLRIIPVFLAEPPQETSLLKFLKLFTWVDFRRTDPDPMQLLIQGITLEPPYVNLSLIAEIQRMTVAEIKAIIPNNLTLPGAIAFVGRTEALEDLHDLLQQNNSVAICAVAGMGGIGKTELALQYAYQQRDRATYPGGVCWLKAREDLASQVITFARSHLDLNPPSDLEFAEQLRWCWQHWGDRQTLLLLDDVQDYGDVQKLGIPGRSQFKVLLTTRSHFGKSVRELPLRVLSEAAALELLRSLVDAGQIDRGLDAAKELCQWLGYLPLGVELIGRYLAFDPDLSVATLLAELYQKKLAAEALLAAELGMTSELGVVAAFELSWEKLTAEAQTVAAFLSLFALSEFHWAWVQDCFPEMEASLLNHVRVRQLLGLHLLQRSGEGLYQLHQLLREFFAVKRSQMAGTEEWRLRFLLVICAAAKQSSERPKKSLIEETTQVIPHLQIAITHSEDDDKPLETALSSAELAKLYEAQGRYIDAEPFYEQSLKITERQLGSNHPHVAASINNLALLFYYQGRYSKAEQLFQRSLAVRTQQLGSNHPDVAQSLNNLALIYERQGRYSEAEQLYQRSLAIWEQQLGIDHPDVAISLNNLAEIFYYQGRYSEAEPLHQRSLRIREQQLGCNHPDVAESLHNLAELYYHLERYDEAEPLHQRSLSIRERQLGANHPNVATSLHNLAVLYRAQNRYSEAEPLYQRSLAIREQQLGADHPHVAVSLNDLAGFYRDQNRYNDSEQLYQRSIAILKQQLGADHPDVATSLNNLAYLYEFQERYSEAEYLLGQSLSILEKALPANHPNLAIVRGNLEGLRSQIGQSAE
jgi:tetratricopeptide (TPR) repeat protein